MNKNKMEQVLNKCLTMDIDYAEVYFDDSIEKSYICNKKEIEVIQTNRKRGLGIRLGKDDTTVYGSTTCLDDSSIDDVIQSLSINFKKAEIPKIIQLKEEVVENIGTIEIPHSSWSDEYKKELLLEADQLGRSYSPFIEEVEVGFSESKKTVKIASLSGIYKEFPEYQTRFYMMEIAKRGQQLSTKFVSRGTSNGYEFLEQINYKELIKDLSKRTIVALDAKDFKGGKVPVVIKNGFGAVIFHEACGHPLEATAIAKNQGPFVNAIGKKIAHESVTLVDDGTIPGAPGTTPLDSEGNPTRKNILIEKGILKSYLVDTMNGKKMNQPSTGSARRENYRFCPTSRMNNTYLENGTSTVEELIKSIDYGVYCESFRGGSVTVATADFNFKVEEAFLIENGKLTTPLKDISLIGNGAEVLLKIDGVANDKELVIGNCGSLSGQVRVGIGQPTIRVSEILVGGKVESHE